MLGRLTDFLVAFGPWGLFMLGLIDSGGIPLSAGMDALLILIAIKDPSSAYFAATMAVLGSLGGNIILFMAARRGGKWLRSARSRRSLRFREWFHRYGLVTVFIPALVPIPLPLKIFVISAGALHIRLGTFIAVILLARIPRYFGEAYLAVQLGQQSTQYLKDHAVHLLAISAGLFVALYLLLKVAERYRRPPRDAAITPPET